MKGAACAAVRAGRKAASKALRNWAGCLGRIFEVDPIKCNACGGTMRPIAVITDDKELTRLLVYMGLEGDFPVTTPARSPPMYRGDEETQLDPATDKWDGVDKESPEV